MAENKLFTVIVTPRAKNNFRSVVSYLDYKWNTQVTENFMNSFDKTIDLLAINPFMYPEYSKEKKIRKCIITKHNVMYYKVVGNKVEILRIRNTMKNPNTLKF